MSKYARSQQFSYPSRTWPSQTIEKAPHWCSVDLRDGNQALANPMNPEKKMRYFKYLMSMGFKDIEISFPSASKDDYDFTRTIIEQGLIPDDTTIQVLTQARSHLIEKTFEAIKGCKSAIIHVYNSTSPAQREIVFRKTRQEIITIALDAVKQIRDCSLKHDGKIILEYSPESFSQTEVDFASDICNRVVETWNPQGDEKVIINFPSTVEITTPVVFADQIQYMIDHFDNRENVIVSVHTHNDRGCAIAAAEMALLAGAERVEGTLFGNGERTGNTDIVTMALNLYSKGVDPQIDVFNITEMSSVYEECTGMDIHKRHPYAGELVFTAFSGSHQDAISKGLSHYKHTQGQWNVPYLPIDPADIGRTYDAVIRINSQSGKGGASYIMESVYGFQIPKDMQPSLGKAVQNAADTLGRELNQHEVYECFNKEFLIRPESFSIQSFSIDTIHGCIETHGTVSIKAEVFDQKKAMSISGKGNGSIDAFVNALETNGISCKVLSFHEHSINSGSNANAVAYIMISDKKDVFYFGAGIDTDITTASLKALGVAVAKMRSSL
jgi:2-isopropylmalate synthase